MMAKAGGVSGAGFTVPAGDLPVLTRCLARLQLLDAIAGQLDRHLGNYYIASDASGPVLVIGIDNDLAFRRKGPAVFNSIGSYRGIPPVIDTEFGRAVLNLQWEKVHDLLTGMLEKDALELLGQRLEHVQQQLRDQKFVDGEDWGEAQTRESLAMPSYARELVAPQIEAKARAGLNEGLGQYAGTKGGPAFNFMKVKLLPGFMGGDFTLDKIEEKSRALGGARAAKLNADNEASFLKTMAATEPWNKYK